MLDAFTAALRDLPGNASSTHSRGQEAGRALENSRRTLAGAIGCSSRELVFTSGGTESNNLAILGLVRAVPQARKHVITTAIEHPSVLEPIRQLELEGVEVSRIAVPPCGVLDAGALARYLQRETVLISVMHSNNETGALQPIREIAALLRERRLAGQQIFLHSDGVQSLGKVDARVDQLGVDLYSLSAHKIYGPKGVGALFVRNGTPLSAIQFGGRHERERRAGTENVPGAVAFARAVELLSVSVDFQVGHLRDRFEQQVLSRIEEAEINGSVTDRLPNTSNMLFRDISGEALLIALDTRGFAVSTGSACSSGSIEPSHVLLAMGRSPAEARSSVRFSFGRYNTAEEVDQLSGAVVESVARLRKTNKWRPELVSQ